MSSWWIDPSLDEMSPLYAFSLLISFASQSTLSAIARATPAPSDYCPILPLFHVSLYLMLISFSFLCWLISHISVLCYFSGCFRSLTYTCDLAVHLQVVSPLLRQRKSITAAPFHFPPPSLCAIVLILCTSTCDKPHVHCYYFCISRQVSFKET